MAIALVQSDDRLVNQLQSNIKQVVDPIDQNPLVKGSILSGVTLSIGSNTINHGLGRTLQGWFVVRQRAATLLYDTQDSNTMPSKTLNLNSSAAVTVDLYVF